MSWKLRKKIPAKNALLTVVTKESKSIKKVNDDIVDNFCGEEPLKVSEQSVKEKMKELIPEKTNQYVTQNNTT